MQTHGSFTSNRAEWAILLGAFAPYALLLCSAYFMFSETVDDPYITFRYAANLLAGHGAVFNVGERVEGYSSPLHLLLSAGLLLIAPTADILFKAKCASLFFAFVVLAQTGMLARRSGLSRWEAILAQTMLALNINFALASVNALETTLYGSLLLASTLMFLAECNRRQGYASSAVLFLALSARPEASIVVMALFITRLFWMRRKRIPIRFVSAWLLVFLIPSCLYEYARWEYYGMLLPNTYFAKAQSLTRAVYGGAIYMLRPIWPGAPMVKTALQNVRHLNSHNLLAFNSEFQQNIRSGIIYTIMTPLFWLLVILGFLRTKHKIYGLIAITIVTADLIFVIKAGGDWMHGWRFMVPTLPILTVVQCYGIRTISEQIVKIQAKLPLRISHRDQTASSVRHGCQIGMAVLLLFTFCASSHFPWGRTQFSTNGEQLLMASNGFGAMWAKGAEYIKQNLPHGCVVAYSEMGYAGYTNMDKKFIDMNGLTDAEIAQLPTAYKTNTGVADPDWNDPKDHQYQILRRKNPDYLMTFGTGSSDNPPKMLLDHYRIYYSLYIPDKNEADKHHVYAYQRM